MFRALFWKEWRQLALVRWGGVAIGVVIPLAFLAGAEMAQRGALPTGIDRYSSRDILFEIIPVTFLIGLWPLIGLMTAVQSFAGDRSTGNESFLLERPVRAGLVWRARLAASFATLVTVIAATTAFGIALGAAVGPPASGWSRWIETLEGAGALAPLAYLGGMIAASVLAVPLGAVLAGAALAALPVLFGLELGSLFPHARLWSVPVGLALPALMLPAYIVASWAAFCRGEPAGRGRVARGLGIAAASIPLVLLLFVVMAPISVRAEARAGMHEVVASPSGADALVLSAGERWGGGGWLIDARTGQRREFLPPPFQSVVWSPDGSRFAIGSWSGALGAERKAMRLEIHDGRDGHLIRSIDVPDEEPLLWGLAWTGDGMATARPSGRNAKVAVIDPGSGTFRDTGFVNPGWATLTAPRPDGRVFLRTPVYDPASDPNKMRGYRLRPVDVAAGTVGAPLVDASGAPLCFAGWLAGLSNDGRFATLTSVEPGGPARVAALPSGSQVMTIPSAASARWLEGDSLAWTVDSDGRTRLFVESPGSSPRAIREWAGAHVRLDPSPDGRSVLVAALSGVNPDASGADRTLFEKDIPRGVFPEIGVFTLDDRRWRTLTPFGPDEKRDVRWAGPKTIAWTAPGVVALEDLDHPGVKRFVLGSEADLR